MPSLPISRRTIVLLVFATVISLLIVFNIDTGRSYLATINGQGSLKNIKNSTLGFQQIFVVNLKSRTDRRDGMALAASYTGLDLTFTEAVTEVSEKALPPSGSEQSMSKGAFGDWRSHLNIARRMVEENIQTALIMEDDVDWDIRIHEQLMEFAQASQLLLQPTLGTKDEFLDPTYHGDLGDLNPKTFYVGEQKVTPPTTSPYGDVDKWDMLWLGHCGATIPTGKDDSKTPLARAVVLNDNTVPEKQHINLEISSPAYRDDYPAHSRVVFRTGGNVCTLAYALTNAGARRLLYELGVQALQGAIDTELDSWCRGRSGRSMHTCLTVGPQYFQHHRPAGRWGSMSDIGDMPTHYNDFAFTTNIRWSTRVNLPKLVSGDTNYTDMFRDGEPATGL
ncbi:hypothetical protein AMS68_002669 [Peltaster fructicola]|uniref:Glycosyl transferase family 25 domain-containing protein n=1 Tax=Peltaster fructicola TaxID=286661 RepID=A0A6H0XQV5_9PEZI|nr:hypothetical protein AMS68_002669 [Peltaster fructicola]